jgi:hypothetical protein
MQSNRHLVNAVITGNVGGLAALGVALARARREPLRPAAPLNAVSHIWSGRSPLWHALFPTRRNALIGFALHQGAAIFWAGFFEPLFGRGAERSTALAVAGGAATAAAAYVTDYHVVSKRFRPGFEVSLSGRSLFLVYATLGLAFALSARSRGFRHHEVENDDEGDERRHAERRPDAMVAPVERRQGDAAPPRVLGDPRHADLQPYDRHPAGAG